MKSPVLSLMFVLGFVLPVHAQAKEIILDYDVGFQAGNSKFKIFDDGSIEHTERICCPPTNKPIAEARLGAAEMKKLRAMIRSATKGSIVKEDNYKFALGQRVGFLKVFENGQEILLAEFKRTLVEDGSKTLNTAPESLQIEAFVAPYVKNILREEARQLADQSAVQKAQQGLNHVSPPAKENPATKQSIRDDVRRGSETRESVQSGSESNAAAGH